ncbi:MAG: hypothetical protein HYU68_04730 [Bacteroidetes bacterium]|nr:hypothetical protein [Bacteroidota bacterium]
MEQKEAKEKAVVVFLVIGLILAVFNQIQLFSMKMDKDITETPTGLSIVKAEVVPEGTPRVYGKELSVSYDDVSATNQRLADATINKLGDLDNKIKLTEEELERYVSIVSQISCEYCCGAQSIIVRQEDVDNMNAKIDAAIKEGQITEEEASQYRTKAGEPACGCAHSFAMRGLAKYLITEHGNEFTDDEILEELGKWKTLFFPGQMQQKAEALKENGIEFNYINLASNKYRGIEQGNSGGGMVGGC